MKTVNRTDLKKLVRAVFFLFEAQDDYCRDGRVIAACERAVNHWLDNITDNPEERRAIRESAEHSLWAARTWEVLEEQLRALGFEIEEEEKKK